MSHISIETHQVAVLEGIKHLKVTTGLPTVKVGNIFPESINTSQCHQPLRIQLPCIPTYHSDSYYKKW